MFRRQSTTAVALALGASSRGVVNYKADFLRSPEIDRADLQYMYPTAKPNIVAGQMNWDGGAMTSTQHKRPMFRKLEEARALMPKKARCVTVYGASGFLGAQIVRELLAHPEIEKVRACTRYPTHIKSGTDLDNILNEDHGDRLELHECDITNRLQCNVAANGSDTLIVALDYFVESTNNSHMEVNNFGFTNVASSAAHVRAERVILCSYSHSHQLSWSAFSDTLGRGENQAHNAFMDVCSIRFGPLYGEGYRYRGLGNMIYGCVFPNAMCQPLWVKDAARAVVLAARSDRVVRAKMDLGGPETMSHLNFVKKMAKNYNNRVIIPLKRSTGIFLAKAAGWLLPNVIDEHYAFSWELDQLPRPASYFDGLMGWDRLEYSPKTMEDARKIEKTGTDINGRPLEPLTESEDIMLMAEDRDKAAFREEEIDARKQGIWRAVAGPSWGQSEPGIADWENEIYPGHQFRYEPLHDADYRENAPNPGPNAVF